MDSSLQSDIEQFLQDCPVRTYNKGEIIVFQGEAPRSGYMVKSGVIKSYNLSANGDERPVGFYSAGDLFPGPWIFGKMPNATYYYEAFSDKVVVHLVPRESYMRFLKSHPDFMFAQLESYVVDHLGKSMRLNGLQHSRAGDKLIYTLHYLVLKHGEKLAPNVTEIKLDLTHQDFANLTGLTRETAATELNKLKHLGVIDYGKGKPYQIKHDKLGAMLNDQFVADLRVKL